MELRNCMICGKAFPYAGGKPICPSCRREIEEAYDKVRRFLRDNPKLAITISELSELTGVEEEIINVLIDEGLIELKTPEGTLARGCARCGAPVEGSSAYCARCAALVKMELLGQKEGKGEEAKPREEAPSRDRLSMYMAEVLKRKKSSS